MAARATPAGAPGDRLALGAVMAQHGVSMQMLAAACGISKTAAFSIAAHNHWPRTRDAGDLRARAEALLRERGASPMQIARAWAPEQALPPSTPPTPPTKATDMLLAKQTMTSAAARAFHLFTNPFDGEVNTSAELFQNSELRFIREAMYQAGKNGRFVAVVGESGSGKTTLLADLEERIEHDRAQIVIVRPSVLSMTETDSAGRILKMADILAAIILTLNPHARIPQSHEARTRLMQRMVEDSGKVGNGHLVVIEEAHALSDPTLVALKRLTEQCRIGRRAALGVLLLAHPELLSKLDERRSRMREVTQRCEVVQLPPLDNDMEAYLEHRARAQGKKLAELIDTTGLAELRARLTVAQADKRHGVISLLYPLALNNLMTACLNKAAELGAPLITRDVVRVV